MATAATISRTGASLNVLYPNFNRKCAWAMFDTNTRDNKHPRYVGPVEASQCTGDVDDALLLISERIGWLSAILDSLESYSYAYQRKRVCISLNAFTHYLVKDMVQLEKDIINSQMIVFDASISAADQAILRRVNYDNLKSLLNILHDFVFETWDRARCLYGVGVRF